MSLVRLESTCVTLTASLLCLSAISLCRVGTKLGSSSKDLTQVGSEEMLIRARQASVAITSSGSDTKLIRLLWIDWTELSAVSPSGVPVKPRISARATALTSSLLFGVRNWQSSSTIFYLKSLEEVNQAN